MEKNFEGFTGCVTMEEVIYRYLTYEETGVELAVLDWVMYAYIDDNLADGIWKRLREGVEMDFRKYEWFQWCETVSEVIHRYFIYKEMGVESAVLDWVMYDYLYDNLADGLWDRFRGVRYEG